jgi:hypothetical protein
LITFFTPHLFIFHNFFFGQAQEALHHKAFAQIRQLFQLHKTANSAGVQLALAIAGKVLWRSQANTEQARINVEASPAQEHFEFIIQFLHD